MQCHAVLHMSPSMIKPDKIEPIRITQNERPKTRPGPTFERAELILTGPKIEPTQNRIGSKPY